MAIFFLIIASVITAVDLALILLWITNYKDKSDGIQETPFISILIAARNEQENLADCLDSIINLDYPMEQLEVLVGNDMSDDQTGDIAEAYSVRHPFIKHISIYKTIIDGNGKANVLAQLVKKAKSEYLFITDADISVPEDWIRSMLRGMTTDIALVTGTAIVVGKNLLAYMQQIDWLFATGMLKVVSDLNIPVTTMGNNMLVRKSVYDEIGGYEALPFSVTEDLELFNHIKEKHNTVNLFNPGVLNKSKPQKSLMDLLIQRKRWMRGAFELPKTMIALLLMQASYAAIILGLLITYPLMGWLALGLRLLFRFTFISLVVNKLNSRVNLFGSIIFELYSATFSLVSLFFYLFSGEVEWKGRKYSKND